MSEYAAIKSRGMMISLVFAMQAAGLLFGPLFAAALLSSPLSHNLVWRILLGFGGIPAFAVLYWRRKIDETPLQDRAREAARATARGVTAPATSSLNAVRMQRHLSARPKFSRRGRGRPVTGLRRRWLSSAGLPVCSYFRR